jgi:hypothetical protein
VVGSLLLTIAGVYCVRVVLGLRGIA